jgi:hypothetical protein
VPRSFQAAISTVQHKWKLGAATLHAGTSIGIRNVDIAAWKDSGTGEKLHRRREVGLESVQGSPIAARIRRTRTVQLNGT